MEAKTWSGRFWFFTCIFTLPTAQYPRWRLVAPRSSSSERHSAVESRAIGLAPLVYRWAANGSGRQARLRPSLHPPLRPADARLHFRRPRPLAQRHLALRAVIHRAHSGTVPYGPPRRIGLPTSVLPHWNRATQELRYDSVYRNFFCGWHGLGLPLDLVATFKTV